MYASTPMARRIRQEGDGERGAEIKRLRKPSVPVWVVDAHLRRLRKTEVFTRPAPAARGKGGQA
jgi:hypothetical protein